MVAVLHEAAGRDPSDRELSNLVGLTMVVYTSEPGSKSEQALNLLASWTATPDEDGVRADHEEQPRPRSRAE
jgi:hypothetical protein